MDLANPVDQKYYKFRLKKNHLGPRCDNLLYQIIYM